MCAVYPCPKSLAIAHIKGGIEWYQRVCKGKKSCCWVVLNPWRSGETLRRMKEEKLCKKKTKDKGTIKVGEALAPRELSALADVGSRWASSIELPEYSTVWEK